MNEVELLEEIEREITRAIDNNCKAIAEFEKTQGLNKDFLFTVSGRIEALRGIGEFVAELKKKHTFE